MASAAVTAATDGHARACEIYGRRRGMVLPQGASVTATTAECRRGESSGHCSDRREHRPPPKPWTPTRTRQGYRRRRRLSHHSATMRAGGVISQTRTARHRMNRRRTAPPLARRVTHVLVGAWCLWRAARPLFSGRIQPVHLFARRTPSPSTRCRTTRSTRCGRLATTPSRWSRESARSSEPGGRPSTRSGGRRGGATTPTGRPG